MYESFHVVAFQKNFMGKKKKKKKPFFKNVNENLEFYLFIYFTSFYLFLAMKYFQIEKIKVRVLENVILYHFYQGLKY